VVHTCRASTMRLASLRRPSWMPLLRQVRSVMRSRWALGAASLTLHVFNRNERAKSLYVAEGYELELVRAVKWLDGGL